MGQSSNKEQGHNTIKCQVKNCAHHSEDNCCHAKEISVGPAFAACCGDTTCSTFKPTTQTND